MRSPPSHIKFSLPLMIIRISSTGWVWKLCTLPAASCCNSMLPCVGSNCRMAESIENPVFDLRGLALREFGKGTSRFRMIVIGKEVLLVLASLVVAVASEQRRGAGAVVRNKPLAYFSERGRRGLLRSEDLFKNPSGLKGEHECA